MEDESVQRQMAQVVDELEDEVIKHGIQVILIFVYVMAIIGMFLIWK